MQFLGKVVDVLVLQVVVGAVQFLDKVVDLPVVCNVVVPIVVRQCHRSWVFSARRGAHRDVPVLQIEKFFVEVNQLPQIMEEIMKVILPGVQFCGGGRGVVAVVTPFFALRPVGR